MRWSSWVWALPAAVLLIGLAAPWILLLTGGVQVQPAPTTVVISLFGQAAILAFSWRYLTAIGFWLVCMTRRNRDCLHDTGNDIWYLDPTVLTFARSDVVKVAQGLKSRSTHTVEIVLRSRAQPVKINARHFEGGIDAVVAFVAPSEPTSANSGVGPWG
jgi:hypothetical protein